MPTDAQGRRHRGGDSGSDGSLGRRGRVPTWVWVLFAMGFAGIVAWFVVASVALDDPSDTPSGTSPGTSSGTSALRIGSTGSAVAPFAGLTTTSLALDGDCKHLVVADNVAERVAGLRGRTQTAPYDGMLFVFDGPTTASFTMSGVTEALDIGFYDADGRPVSHTRMQPCEGSTAECPVYSADAPFVYAIETEPGALGSGSLSSCPS